MQPTKPDGAAKRGTEDGPSAGTSVGKLHTRTSGPDHTRRSSVGSTSASSCSSSHISDTGRKSFLGKVDEGSVTYIRDSSDGGMTLERIKELRLVQLEV